MGIVVAEHLRSIGINPEIPEGVTLHPSDELTNGTGAEESLPIITALPTGGNSRSSSSMG